MYMQTKNAGHVLPIFVLSAQNLHTVGVPILFLNELTNRHEYNPGKLLTIKDFKLIGKTGQRLAGGLEAAPDLKMGLGYNLHYPSFASL